MAQKYYTSFFSVKWAGVSHKPGIFGWRPRFPLSTLCLGMCVCLDAVCQRAKGLSFDSFTLWCAREYDMIWSYV